MTRLPFRPKPGIAVLGVYAVTVAVIAFWPTPVDRPISGLLRSALGRLHELGAPAWFDYAFVEFSANVLLFLPIGFMVAALLGGGRLMWFAIAIGAVASVAIECVQWVLLPARYPSLWDALANTLGAALGTALLAMVLKIRAKAQTP